MRSKKRKSHLVTKCLAGIRIQNLAENWKTSPPSQKDVDNKFATKLQNCKLCCASPFPSNCTFNVFLCNYLKTAVRTGSKRLD